MTFSQWMFGGIPNPYKGGQWGTLHIATLLLCVALIIGFYFIVKRARDKERTRQRIVFALVGAILFFEIMIRFVQCVKLYHLHLPEMSGLNFVWIMVPKPWCAISCWALIACVFVKKSFFYNFASLSALLCALIFFSYPGVGFNNEYLLFENWYSILTHALLLITSITLMVLKYADFKYRELWKTAVCFVLTFVYAFIEIFILDFHDDPMYFMPNGDIQADILKISYGLYIFLYSLLILTYINTAHMLGDRAALKAFIERRVHNKYTRKTQKAKS